MSKAGNAGVVVVSNGKYWQARFCDSQGELRRVSIGPKAKYSRKESQSRAWELHAQHVRNPASVDRRDNPTIRGWERYYFAQRYELSKGTRVLLAQTFGKLAAFFGDDARIRDIRPVSAQEWRSWLSATPALRGKTTPDSPKLSDQSVCRHVRDAKAIWSLAVSLKILDSNPFSALRGTPAKLEHDWPDVTRDDLQRILAACPSKPWRNLFALCRLAGLRLGEALRATYEDIDAEERTIRVHARREGGVRRETTKQRARTVPIEPGLWAIIGDGSGLIAPVPLRNIHRDALVIVARAGLPAYRKPFHSLRKNLETEWMDVHPPMTVCQWLGHSPQVAADHYVRTSRTVMAAVTGRGDPLADAQNRIRELEAKLAGL